VEKVIKPVMPPELMDEENVIYHINPTAGLPSGGLKRIRV
jgi:hypothetical protein